MLLVNVKIPEFQTSCSSVAAQFQSTTPASTSYLLAAAKIFRLTAPSSHSGGTRPEGEDVMRDEKQARGQETEVQVPAGPLRLPGSLGLPPGTPGIVLFAHGSGSSRHSPRNQYVARILREAGVGTLLFDLLTPQEESSDVHTGHLRFNISLLAKRVISAIDWLRQNPDTRHLRIGCFGASTGAGAALVAAAERPDVVQAVVSRGGRPDLAGSALSRARAPTLLLVGGEDGYVIELNRQALVELGATEKELRLINGASHLFEEPGTLEAVARLAANWFVNHLLDPAARIPRATTSHAERRAP
jgi:putative phosphoribosyl transferase